MLITTATPFPGTITVAVSNGISAVYDHTPDTATPDEVMALARDLVVRLSNGQKTPGIICKPVEFPGPPRSQDWNGGIYVIRDVWRTPTPQHGSFIRCEYATKNDAGNTVWSECREGGEYADIEPFERIAPPAVETWRPIETLTAEDGLVMGSESDYPNRKKVCIWQPKPWLKTADIDGRGGITLPFYPDQWRPLHESERGHISQRALDAALPRIADAGEP